MKPPIRIEPGTLIDGFTVGEVLHSGGMSVIYHATRADCAFPLALKVPRFGHGEPSTSVVSFEVERLMFERLSGRHLPRFVAAGDLERLPYIAMEFVEGRPLEQWIGHGPVDPDEVAKLGTALAAATHSVHLQEAIHLDVKPGNVIVRPNGSAVLLDFGLAHHAQFPDLLAEQFQKPIGSAPYMAPEQVLAVRCDPRSDIFAIGVTLYELATGRLPYGMPQTVRGLRKRCTRDPTPPRKLVATLPAWLQEVILRCLEPDARRRYASAAQLALDLANPDQVTITERGDRLRPAGLWTRIKRWIRVAGYEPAPCPPPSTQIAKAPIVLVCVDLNREREADVQAVAEAARRAILSQPDCRVVCATVIRPLPQWGTSDPEKTSAREHLRVLVELRRWASEADLPTGRITFHVLESKDPAEALLAYARSSNVDSIVIGTASGTDEKPRLGSVGSRVVSEAPCNVTVARLRARRETS